MAMTKVKNLQLWCKKMTEGYRDVEVRDMTTSWKNGLAFCALIHKFRPDLIDYDSLSKENILDNNQMAFDIAEKELNIPAFLDAPDMVAIKVPDRLSVVTYVSQYYNNLHDKPQLGGPDVKKHVATKRHKQDADSGGPEAKRLTPSHINKHTPAKERQVSMGDKCHICGDKVYLMERHLDKNKLYHRHCFRHSELSPTSKVFNKSELKKISDKVKSEDEAKKTRDKMKSENEATKENKSQAQPDFWQRRNQNRKVEKMDIEEPVSSKDAVNNAKNDKPFLTKDFKKAENLVISDQNKANENISSKTDRPSKLDLDTKAELKKSHDIKPSPRIHKIVKSEHEPMETNEVDNINLKPVPTPRNLKEEKDKHKMNGFLSKTRDKFRDKSPSSKSHSQKISTCSPISPMSPPPLPSQPPPAELVKSDLLSPRRDKGSLAANFDEKSKSSVSPDRKSLQFSAKTGNVSPRTPKSPKFSAKTEMLSPRTTKLHEGGSSVFGSNGVSLDSSRNSADTKNLKLSPTSRGQPVSSLSPTTKSTKASFDHHVDHAIELTKNGSNSNEAVAFVFQPNQNQQEESDKQVLGGLLSNLANIRRKKPSDSSPSDDSSDNQKKGQTKSAILSKPFGDTDQKLLGDTESHSKQDNKKSDSDIPEWKRQLEMNKKARPKSADLLSDKKEFNKLPKSKQEGETQRPKTELSNVSQRPKSVDVLSDKFKVEQKPQWQIEAEKRIEARKSGYVDPEKSTKSQIDSNKDTKHKDETKHEKERTSIPIKPTRVDIKITDDQSADIRKRVLPTVPVHPAKTDDKENTQEKKRISVNVKFNFSKQADEEKAGKLKPARPPPVSSGSHMAPHKPARPPPPLKDGDHKRLSPSDIQKQLSEIDTRLTEMEIRGRQLEDSIRKAQEEEDDKMMVEWFDLVNDKNELVRKEADLVYLSRAQELENEQHEIERRLRDLMLKDDKSKEDNTEEEFLIQKKLDVVNQRSLIVDSIDEDRIRYEEEDKDIAMALQGEQYRRKRRKRPCIKVLRYILKHLAN